MNHNLIRSPHIISNFTFCISKAPLVLVLIPLSSSVYTGCYGPSESKGVMMDPFVSRWILIKGGIERGVCRLQLI